MRGNFELVSTVIVGDVFVIFGKKIVWYTFTIKHDWVG